MFLLPSNGVTAKLSCFSISYTTIPRFSGLALVFAFKISLVCSHTLSSIHPIFPTVTN